MGRAVLHAGKVGTVGESGEARKSLDGPSERWKQWSWYCGSRHKVCVEKLYSLVRQGMNQAGGLKLDTVGR